MNTIKFYKPNDPFGEFSNFSLHPITLDEKVWPTVEHFFQAQKFHRTPLEEEIRLSPSPMEAKISGQDRNKPLRKDWEKVKDDVMRRAIYAKFTQHNALRNKLISTGDSYIAESTKNDSYWADGGHGKGRNMLGIILMETRDKLKSMITSGKT